jgi:hypothetical protein
MEHEDSLSYTLEPVSEKTLITKEYVQLRRV